MNNNCLVSLVTPGWNGKLFIHRLLDSIIAQTYRPIEYIYVDDGSTDGTAEVVKSYSEKFREAGIDFKFIQQENKGLCEALMTGWQHVTGEYLSNPEYDDVLLPDSVAKKVEYLESHPDCAVVTADAWMVFEDSLECREKLISHHNTNRFDRNHFFQALTGDIIWNAACIMMRMDRFDEVHPKRTILPSRYGPNMQILLPLFYYWNRGFIEDPLSLYVLRNDSLSTPRLTFNQELERLETHRKITLDALQKIQMPAADMVICLKRLKMSIDRSTLQISYRHHVVDVFWKAYESLRMVDELREEHLQMAREIRYWRFFKAKLFIKRIYNSVARIINYAWRIIIR